jgi:sec-independent protein translocase protein TatB
MIEISFAKLVLLALIALIVLGPEKLPGAARTAGALLRRVRNGWESVRSEVERELEVEEIRRAAREAAARAEAAQNEFKQDVAQAREPLEAAAAELREAAASASEPVNAGSAETAAAPVAGAQQELPLPPAPVKENADGGH